MVKMMDDVLVELMAAPGVERMDDSLAEKKAAVLVV